MGGVHCYDRTKGTLLSSFSFVLAFGGTVSSFHHQPPTHSRWLRRFPRSLKKKPTLLANKMDFFPPFFRGHERIGEMPRMSTSGGHWTNSVRFRHGWTVFLLSSRPPISPSPHFSNPFKRQPTTKKPSPLNVFNCVNYKDRCLLLTFFVYSLHKENMLQLPLGLSNGPWRRNYQQFQNLR